MKKSSKEKYTAKVLNSKPFGKMFYLILTKGPQYKKDFETFTGFKNPTISQYLNTNFKLFEDYFIPIFRRDGLINYNSKWGLDDKTFIELFLQFIEKNKFDIIFSGKPIKPINQKYAGKKCSLVKLKEKQKELIESKNEMLEDYKKFKKSYLTSTKADNIKEAKIYKEKMDYCALETHKLSNLIKAKEDIKKYLKNKQLIEECFYDVLLPKLKEECSKISKNEFDKCPCVGFLFARALNKNGKWKKGVFEVIWKKNNRIIKITKDYSVTW